MTNSRPLSGRLMLGLIFAQLLSTKPVWAEDGSAPEPTTTESSAPQSTSAVESPSAEQSLGVEIEITNSTLAAASVQAALEKELLVRTRATDRGERLRLRIDGLSLDASYGDPKQRSVSRHVELPSDEAQQLELIALLSGNLVRDEAHALLVRLRGEPSKPEAGAPSPKATGAAREPTSTSAKIQQKPKEKPRSEMPASLTLFSPVSTDPNLAEHEAHFDVGVAYSEIGRLDGMAVEAGVLHVEDGGRGLMIAGIGSTTGPFEGMNVSGFYGVDERAQGLSIAGFYLRHRQQFRGLSVSLVNAARGAGKVDVDKKPALASRGAMIGLVNIGANLIGTQIGLVNIQTGSMRGSQIGLINVSNHLRGGAIGLLNFGPGVRIQGLAWASMSPELDNPARQVGPMAHLGVKYRIQNFYSLVSFGVAAEASGCGTDPSCPSPDALLAPGFGAGYSFGLGRAFALEIDGLYQVEFSPRGAANTHGTVAGRLTALWNVARQVSVFAGGGPRVIIPNHDDEQTFFGPTFHAGIELF